MAKLMNRNATPSGNASNVKCSTCATAFAPRLRYQVDVSAAVPKYYCSLPCKAAPDGDAACSQCATAFTPVFAYQTLRNEDGSSLYVCSERCSAKLQQSRHDDKQMAKKVAWRIAVLNQKGGTGKTTTSVSLAAGLATEGRRVLLVDADPQGNVGTSLGVRAPRTLADVLTKGVPLVDVIVPLGETLDVVCADERLAQAEIELARHPRRAGILARALQSAHDYDHVIIDCGPSLSLINQNALCAVHDVLCPVACDYLSLVGVKQVLRTLDNVRKHLGHPIAIAGVLPTMYDARARVCRDALKTLQAHFGDACLTPIRQNTKLKEAPAHKKTIFEHDPSSSGAKDYQKLVDWALLQAPKSSAKSAVKPRARQKPTTSPQKATTSEPNTANAAMKNAPQKMAAPKKEEFTNTVPAPIDDVVTAAAKR